MGGAPAKPEFVSILTDKQVKQGDDVTLHCEASIEGVTATWEKDDQSLQCLPDKYRKKQNGAEFTLKIKKAEKEDEGNYTVTLENKSVSASCSAMVTVELKEWRKVEWNPKRMITPLKKFKIDEVTELRFLLHGPIGAGKSSVINTIKSILEEHQFVNSLVASALTGHSFTTKFEKFPVETLPFAFYDVMGLEADNKQEGTLAGVHKDDVVKALKGHMTDDYEFQPEASISEDNKYYISNPTLNNKIHCLISVVAADKVTMMNDGVIQKMKTIRAEASKLGIPQLVFLTRVDQACKMTQKDLTKIYRSKKIKEMMEQCSVRLGIPVNCIFPVKNYHEETKIDKNLNCLILEGLTQGVNAAHDYVKMSLLKQKPVE